MESHLSTDKNIPMQYIYIYHLLVPMLHITVVQYEKGDRQKQNVQKTDQMHMSCYLGQFDIILITFATFFYLLYLKKYISERLYKISWTTH